MIGEVNPEIAVNSSMMAPRIVENLTAQVLSAETYLDGGMLTPANRFSMFLGGRSSLRDMYFAEIHLPTHAIRPKIWIASEEILQTRTKLVCRGALYALMWLKIWKSRRMWRFCILESGMENWTLESRGSDKIRRAYIEKERFGTATSVSSHWHCAHGS